MSLDSPPPGPSTGLPLKVSAVVGLLAFVELASGAVQGFYQPLFGELAERAGLSHADITWFVVLQTLSAAVSVPILAKLGDMFGHRRVLRIAVISVLLGALLVALSENYGLMLLGRVLMGPLAVWLPLEVALVHNRIRGETARRSIGLLVGALTIGLVAGVLVSGAVASVLPFTVVLLVPVAVVAVAAVIVMFAVPESTIRSPRGIDFVGFAGLGIAMLALLWGLKQAQSSGWGASATLVPLAVGVVTLVAWALWERRVANPAVDLRLVLSRNMWPIYVTSFLIGTVLFGSQTLLTTFLATDPATSGYGFDLTPSTISFFLAAVAGTSTVGAASFAPVAKYVGMRGVLLGATVLGAAGCLSLALAHSQLWQIWLAVGLSGVAGGALTAALPALIAESAPLEQTGIAAGLYSSLKMLGGAAGGAVFGLVLASFLTAGSEAPTEQGYLVVWLLCAAAYALCPIALSFLRSNPMPSTDTGTGHVFHEEKVL